MKKVLLGILVWGLLVGCGNKGDGPGSGSKLVCSNTDAGGSGNVTTISYKGDKVLKVNMVSSLVVGTYYAEMMAELYESPIAVYDSIKGIKAKVVVSDDKDKISMVFDLDLDKLDYEALARLSGSDVVLKGIDQDSRSLVKFRSNLESSGYTCK